MALRVTKTSLLPTESTLGKTPLQLGEETAVLLGARAGAALQSGQTKEYLELFARAAEIEHDTPRYRTWKLLVEQGLQHASDTSERQATEILLATASGALSALEACPAEPRLLNYAGVALYELWALDGARALFTAAKRLDPEVPHLERNLKALSERSRSRPPGRLNMHPALRGLSQRAKRVAGRAKPAEGMRISLCMIMRDEEEMLPRTLEAIAPAVDEMIIVDTGSTDRSIEIARSFGATVIEREWTGDFSAARNVSLEAATGDWFIYLDADEVLVAEDAAKLRELAGHTWCEAMFLDENNFTGSEEVGVSVVHAALRMLRNRPEYRFTGRLHEQIANTLPRALPERIVHTPVRVNHYGYLGVVRDAKEKSRRNLELLEKQREDGVSTAFLHYNLGSEYLAIGESETALAEFQESLRLVEEDGAHKYWFVPSLWVRLVKALRATDRNLDAIEQAATGLEMFPEFTDLVYEQGLAAMHIGHDDTVAYLEKAISMGDAPSRFASLVGAGTFLPRILLAIRHLDHNEIDEAVTLMQWCIEHHPDFYGVLHPYATALLRAGRPAQEIVAEIERRAGTMTATMRFMLGTALFEQGAAPEAEAQFRNVLDAQPHSGAARAALVETLLYQRRYAEAGDEAAVLDRDHGLAATVVRSEMFARLVDGDVAGAEDSLGKAEELGIPSAERSLFRAWINRANGVESRTRIPAAAVPLLELMLEAMLRVQDFENFEVAQRLLEDAELPVRERRELLAQLYLRRGFVRSAGREWIAVCQDRPDARALAGLSRVAYADGQAENAETFAREALALEPGNAVAKAILAASAQPVAA